MDSFYVDIILNITFITIFISVFYFNYVCNVEAEIVKSQAIFLTDDLFNDMQLLPDTIKQTIFSNLPSVKPGLDNEQLQKNHALKKQTYKTLLIIFVIGISLSYYLCNKYNYDFSEHIIYSLVLVCFVCLTEYIFLKIVTSNFITSDPNYIKYSFLNNLQNKLNINLST
jgi:hypothetical protein